MTKKCFPAVLALFFVAFQTQPSFSYNQVRVKKVVPFTLKKTEASVLRIDPNQKLWLLDTDLLSLEQINVDGKMASSIKAGKKETDLFKTPIDFIFRKSGSLIVSDPGLERIAFIDFQKSDESSKKQSLNPVLTKSISIPKPSALALSNDDILAVGNLSDKVVNIYSLDGHLLHKLFAPQKFPFKSFTSITYSKDGVLWVLDGESGVLHRFSPDRKCLGSTENLAGAEQVSVDEYGYAYVTLGEGRWKEINKEGKVIGTFGTKGKSPGQMNSPKGNALLDANSLWVADAGNSRLQLFEIKNEEKEVQLIPSPANRIQVREGSSIDCPISFGAIDSKGQMVLFNSKKNKFDVFDSECKYKTTWMKKGKDVDGFSEPTSAVFDSKGQLWIVDKGDHKIKKVTIDGDISKTIGGKGKKEGSLKSPSLIQVRPDGSFVVVDKSNSRIQVLSSDGLFLFTVGSEGKGKGKFQTVSSIACNQNTIAVFDNTRKALILFDINGKFSNEIVNKENSVPIFDDVVGLASDQKGHFFILDKGTSRVRVFTEKGGFLGDISVESANFIAADGMNRIVLGGPKKASMMWAYVIPKAVDNAKASDATGDIKLEWDGKSEAISYNIYRSSANAAYTLYASTPISPFVDTKVTPAISYQYAIVGVGGLNYEGNWSYTNPLKASRRADVSLISISSATFNPVFVAAFKYYVQNPFGTVTIQNNDDKPYRNVKLSLSLKNYTDFATEKIVPEIAAGEILSVPVTMTFNDKVLELTENTPVQVDLQLHYYEDNKEKDVSQNAPLTLYSRNAISWVDKNRISSFITPRDTPVVEFARAAIRDHIGILKSATIGKPLAKVALLYESINALGIAYVPDPKTPFSKASLNGDTLDYVQFPRETLRRKTGDCDDTTALLAALLQSIGVETVLIDIPGHIFLMANLEETDPDNLGFAPERFVEYKGTYWVPVETTKLGKGFLEAWQAGISNLSEVKNKDTIRFVAALDVTEKYPPVTILEKDDHQPEFPAEKVAAVFPELLKQLQQERYKFRLAQIKEKIEKDPSNESLKIQMGMIHVEGGKSSDGQKVFESLLQSQSADIQASAHNNIGNISFLNGDFKKAEAAYADAIILSPKDGGILINQARVAMKLGDNASAKKYLQEAKEVYPEWQAFTSDFPGELLPK